MRSAGSRCAKPGGDREHAGKVGVDLGAAAARQQHQRAPFADARDLAVVGRVLGEFVEQWVADVDRRHVLAAEELGLERQDRQRRVDGAPVAAHAPRTPRPVLRCDVVQHRNAASPGRLGHDHVQAGKVDEYDEVRRIVAQQAQVGGERAHDQRQLLEYADDAHDRVLAECELQLRAGLRQRPAAERADARCAGAVAQRFDEPRGVGLAARFAGRHEQVGHVAGRRAALGEEPGQGMLAIGSVVGGGGGLQRVLCGAAPLMAARQVQQQPDRHGQRAHDLAQQGCGDGRPDHARSVMVGRAAANATRAGTAAPSRATARSYCRGR